MEAPRGYGISIFYKSAPYVTLESGVVSIMPDHLSLESGVINIIPDHSRKQAPISTAR